jgi:hypothetical protein
MADIGMLRDRARVLERCDTGVADRLVASILLTSLALERLEATRVGSRHDSSLPGPGLGVSEVGDNNLGRSRAQCAWRRWSRPAACSRRKVPARLSAVSTEVGARVVFDGPAEHPAPGGVPVAKRAQVEPSFLGVDVRDVGDPTR